MQDTVGGRPAVDTGLESLSLLLRFHGVAADAAQISHRFGGAPVRVTEMLRCAKEFKFKARAVTTNWTRLIRLSLPAIVEQRDGTFIILAKVTDEQALIQAPSIGRPQLVGRAEFEAGWSGRLVLIARRASLGDLARRFDVTWFSGAQQLPPFSMSDGKSSGWIAACQPQPCDSSGERPAYSRHRWFTNSTEPSA